MEVVLVLQQAKSWAILLSGNMVLTYYHIAEAIRTRKWHIVVNYIQCPKCLCPNNIVVGRQRWEIWVMGRFVSLHSTELWCFAVATAYDVFLDVVPSTSCDAKISRTNATVRTVISFFWRFDKIPSFLVLFFKCLISAPSIWSRCRGGRMWSCYSVTQCYSVTSCESPCVTVFRPLKFCVIGFCLQITNALWICVLGPGS